MACVSQRGKDDASQGSLDSDAVSSNQMGVPSGQRLFSPWKQWWGIPTSVNFFMQMVELVYLEAPEISFH